jgi:hypothetical protein
MKRLPGIEKGPPRAEAAVFGCLALAGIAAILLAISSYAKFVDGSDEVVAALGGRPAVIKPAPVGLDEITLTNVNHIETRTTVAVDPNKV